MNKHYFGATDVGRLRQNNEDAFFVQPVLGGAFLAACVIDGVGGYEGGEVAAQIAQQVLPDYLRIPSGDVPTMMVEAMIAANEKILAEKTKNPSISDMACVATLVLTDETQNRFHYVHVGDTRLYLFRDGSLVKLSKDQSFVGFLEDSGRLSESEAMNHPKRNEINKALGFEPQIKRDYFDTGTSPFLPGDLLLLCSDGLTDLVPSATMTEILAGEESLRAKTAALIEAANSAGGKDNITVVLVQHSRQPRKQRALKPKQKPAAKKQQQQKRIKEAAPQTGTLNEAPVPEVRVQKQPVKKNKAVWLLGITSLVLAASLGWLLYRQYFGGPETGGEQQSAEAVQIAQLMQTAPKDTVRISDLLTAQPIFLSDSIRIEQDTLRIIGNGLHLMAAENYRGAALLLSTGTRHLYLQDVVFQNFAVGILAQHQTIRLKNVQFLNCSVPVQLGNTAPVNSPVNLSIADSLFTHIDTIR